MRWTLGGITGIALLLALTAVPADRAAQVDSESGAARSVLPTDIAAVPAGATTSPLDGSTLVSISLTLALQRAIPLTGGVRGDLTEPQFEATVAPTPSEVATTVEYLRAHGAIDVTPTSDRLGVRAELPAAAVDAAFGISLVQIGSSASGIHYTALGTPTTPSSLHGIVTGVGGLSNLANAGMSAQLARLAPTERVGPRGPPSFVDVNQTSTQLFVGSDYTQAYGVASLFPGANATVKNATFPTHEAVATILLSGYNQTTNSDLPGYDPVAVDAYFNDSFPPSWPHPTIEGVPVTIGGLTPPAPGGDGAINDTSLDETENALDIEMAGSLAPGATVVNFYFSGSLLLGSSSNPAFGSLADDFATTLGDALSYNYSGARLAAVSNSFGLPDLNDTLWNQELVHAAALGVTIVAASGDQGDAPEADTGRFQGQWPTWPGTAANDTFATVSVGGVSMTMTGSPAGWYNGSDLNDSYDSVAGRIATTSVWWDTSAQAGNYSGSEGGDSTVFPEPYWQLHSAAQPAIVNATLDATSFFLGRAGPDLAFAANTTIAYTAHDSGGVYFDLLEGTSVASPLFAGFLASCSAVAGAPFGALDPELYRMASYYAANPTAPTPFIDVTNGSNYLYSAAPGWDPATGWGGLYAPRFLASISNATITGYVYTGPIPGLPPFFPTTGTTTPPYLALAVLGIAITIAVIAIIAFGRPRSPSHLPPIPPGATAPPPPTAFGQVPPVPPPYSGPPGPLAGPNAPSISTMFACPYCGKMRPAEPVRCPSCGAF